MNAAALLLAANLGRNPDKPAFLWKDQAVSYARLARDAARLGNLLKGRGIGPGDRVACVLTDTPGYPATILGAMLLGACPVLLSTALMPEDYAFILQDCGAKALLVAQGHGAAAVSAPNLKSVIPCGPFGPEDPGGVPAELEPFAASADDPAVMMYSSGTTGRPKGVPHSHGDMAVPPRTCGRMLSMGARDLAFSASKLYFAYGFLGGFLLPLAVGATALLYEEKPGPYELLANIVRYRPSVVFCVPTLYNLMLRALEPDTDLSSVRIFYSAGEALPEATFEQWKKLTGKELVDGIGSTEACNVFISNVPGKAVAGTSGLVVPEYEVRLVNDAGEPVAPGERGNLLVRGPGLLRAYWNRPEKTAETLLPDGWMRTGDVYVEKDGFLCHQGRSDDMLKVGAHWVSPMQIENSLLGHEAVAECAVAGGRVEGLLRPFAFVVLRPGNEPDKHLEQALRKHVRSRLPDYMVPVRVVFREELPKTATGKIQRFKLRDAL